MNIKGYLEEVNKEMRKVNWPKRNELISNTIITLVATMVLSMVIWLADQVISEILAFIYA